MEIPQALQQTINKPLIQPPFLLLLLLPLTLRLLLLHLLEIVLRDNQLIEPLIHQERPHKVQISVLLHIHINLKIPHEVSIDERGEYSCELVLAVLLHLISLIHGHAEISLRLDLLEVLDDVEQELVHFLGVLHVGLKEDLLHVTEATLLVDEGIGTAEDVEPDVLEFELGVVDAGDLLELAGVDEDGLEFHVTFDLDVAETHAFDVDVDEVGAGVDDQGSEDVEL